MAVPQTTGDKDLVRPFAVAEYAARRARGFVKNKFETTLEF
tara:strand:- start:3418 stop:3540 length:123 start_codon:yes stop_codon:yes gene_type:complete